jgi:hypothetical protein
MSPRVAGEFAYDGVAMFEIEVWRLEAMGRQDNLRAASRASLVLGSTEETAADPCVASWLVHPEVPDFADTTPRVTAEARVDSV